MGYIFNIAQEAIAMADAVNDRIRISTVAEILGYSKSWVYSNWNELRVRYSLTVVKPLDNGHPWFLRSEIEKIGMRKTGVVSA